MQKGQFRSKGERERDMVSIARLYCEGKSLREIAEEVGRNYETGIAFQQIHRDLTKIREEWRAARIRDFDVAKAEELAKIDRVEANAWGEWYRSREEKTQQSQDEMEKPGQLVNGQRERLTTIKRNVRIERRDGNPYFLDLVLRCIEKRCKILGLEAPSQINIGDGTRTGIEAMVALAQNPEEYGKVDPLLPAEAYQPPPPEPQPTTEPAPAGEQ